MLAKLPPSLLLGDFVDMECFWNKKQINVSKQQAKNYDLEF